MLAEVVDWQQAAKQILEITGTKKYSKNEIEKYLKSSKASLEQAINMILDSDDIDIVEGSRANSPEQYHDLQVSCNVSSRQNYDQTISSSKRKPNTKRLTDIVILDSTSSNYKEERDHESSCEIVEITASSSSVVQQRQRVTVPVDLYDDDCVQIISTESTSNYKKSIVSHSSAIQLGNSSRRLVADEDDLSFLNRSSNTNSTHTVNLFPAIPFLPNPKLEKERKKKSNETVRPSSSTTTSKKESEKAIAARNTAAEEKKRLQQEKKELKAAETEHALAQKTLQSQIKAVNTLKQKVNCAEELIVSMCSEWTNLQETSPTSSTKAIIDSLTGAGAVVVAKHLKIPYSMSFVRKVERIYDFEEAVWRPCTRRLEMEPYALFLITADRLSELILEKSNEDGTDSGGVSGLMRFYQKCIKIHPNCTIIWILENLQEYYKKIQQARSRKENDELRGFLGENVPKRRKTGNDANNKDWDKMPDKKVVEEQLLKVQLAAGSIIKIHPCPSSETAAWIVSFTQQIAFYPEQYVRSSSSLGLSFENNVKSGKGSKETWRRMLQQIPGVSENISHAIVEKYPSCAAFLILIGTKSIADAANLLIGIPVILNGKTRSIGKIVATRVVEVVQGMGNNVVMD